MVLQVGEIKMSYLKDRKWSDRFIPEIKKIVGPLLLVESPDLIDMKEASDLILLRAKNLMVACRVRRPGYLEKFPNDFTMRAKRDSGADTELKKITDGFADWMFYGHSTEEENGQFSAWRVLDLNVWRAYMIRSRELVNINQRMIPNGDGTFFVEFNVDDFPLKLIIAESSLEIELPSF